MDTSRTSALIGDSGEDLQGDRDDLQAMMVEVELALAHYLGIRALEATQIP